MGRGAGRSGGGGGGRSGGGGHRSGGGGGARRTGGGHSTSHHSTTTYHSNSHTTVHVSTGGGGGGNSKAGNFIIGLFFLIFGVVLIIVAAVTAKDMVEEDYDYCNNVETLNRNEQVVCNPTKDRKETWYATYETKGDGHAQTYLTELDDLTEVSRTYKWNNYMADLKGTYDAFSISSVVQTKLTLNVTCTSGSCSSVKMYWLTSSDFYSAIRSDDTFNEDYFKPKKSNFVKDEPAQITMSIVGSEYQFLVFSSLSSAEVTYDAYLEYTVYDTKNLKSKKCSDYKDDDWQGKECKIGDLDKDEVIILDFAVDYTESTAGAPSSDPEYFEVGILWRDKDYSSAITTGVLLGLLGVIFLICAVVFMYKFLKKIGKLGKKVAKKVEKAGDKVEDKIEDKAHSAENKAIQMETVPGQPTATPAGYPADPAYAAAQPYPAQPYPADPNYAAGAQPYPGQAYPGQPYPGDPNYAAGAQPYPGQAYPGQPYPDAAAAGGNPDGTPYTAAPV